MSYSIGDFLFVGDVIFMPDYGTGRCDFHAGSASELYDSIQKIYALPDSTKLMVGHDYQPGGRSLRFCATVAEQKDGNIQCPMNRSREEFIKFRSERDAKLNVPKLLYPSVQVNIDAGRLPPVNKNEQMFLKIPFSAKD